MLKKILIVAAVVVAALIILIAKQPENFSVERSITVDAAADDIFINVNNFHKWESWSPWSKIDSSAENTFEGAESGAGAVMKWSSKDKEVGEGSMKIIGSTLGESVKIELEMTKPYASSSSVEFLFKQQDKQTVVTWMISGKRGFSAKAMSLVSNCNEKIGKKFEEGLANLRKLSETVKTQEVVTEEVK